MMENKEKYIHIVTFIPHVLPLQKMAAMIYAVLRSLTMMYSIWPR